MKTNTTVRVRRELSAKALAFLASVAACTTCAIAALVVMENFSIPGVTWTGAHKLFTVLFSYLQLGASTAYHSPIERDGNTIKGMVYSDLRDDDVHVTVHRWVLQWYASVLGVSAVTTTIGVVVVSMIEK